MVPMHVDLLNRLPSPKFAIPLAITGAAVITTGVVVLIALSILGAPLAPVFIPFSAILVIGTSICLAIAVKAMGKDLQSSSEIIEYFK